MGSIEFLGIIKDSNIFDKINIPINSQVLVSNIDNMDLLYQFLFCIPIILCIMIPTIIKQKKYGIFNKEYKKKFEEENIKKNNLGTVSKQVWWGMKQLIKFVILIFIFTFLISTVLHELLHAVIGVFMGAEMKVGFYLPMFVAIAVTSTSLTKLQYLILLIAPTILLGIIPSIIILLNFPKRIKNPIIAFIATIVCVSTIASAGPDLINFYNFNKQIPNGAIIQDTNEAIYWYMPQD